MLKKMFYSTAICLGLVFSISQNCWAQEKTKEELKAESAALKSEMKSEDTKERQTKIEKLEAEPPKTSGVGSIDGLAENSKKILVETKSINKKVPELYKRTVGEPDTNGVTDVTVKKPEPKELLDVAETLAKQIKAVADATASVAAASADVKSASPMAAGKATKSLNYSKEALALAAPELQMNLKVVNNLIAVLKSSNNN
jgi:hypothetical protein